MRAVAATTWWLDYSVAPSLYWARLTVFVDGAAEVLDLDGRTHRFRDEAAARDWLAEDEYTLWTNLLADGEIAADTEPPSAPDERTLVRLLRVERS